MITMQAYVDTPNASRYLVQLCKHFRHKVPAQWDEKSGRVEFPFGLCVMQLEGERLNIECEAPGQEEYERMKYVLDDHLRRFAWREELELSWLDNEERKGRRQSG